MDSLAPQPIGPPCGEAHEAQFNEDCNGKEYDEQVVIKFTRSASVKIG